MMPFPHCITIWMMVALSVITSVKCNAQEFIFKNINQQSGMPQNSANQLLLDDNGVLWICTEEGLCLYDGTRITIVPTPRLSARIYGIAQYNKDTILIMDEYQKVSLFHNYQELPIQLHIDSIGCFLSNINYYSRHIQNKANKKHLREIGFFRPDQGFFIGNYLIHQKGDKLYKVMNEQVQEIAPDSGPDLDGVVAGQGYLLTTDRPARRIRLFDLDGRSGDVRLPPGFPRRWKLSSSFDTTFAAYVVTDSCLYGLYVTTLEKYSLTKLITNIQYGIAVSQIIRLDKDHYIIGTRTNGIYEYRRNYFDVLRFPPPLISNVRSAIALPDRKTIITRFNCVLSKSGFIRRINGLNWLETATMRSRSGRYYYAVLDKPGFLQFRTTTTPGGKPQILGTASGAGKCTYEDRYGRIWLATDHVMQCYDSMGRRLLSDTFSSASELSGNVITFTERQDSVFWIGTRIGLYTYSSEPHKRTISFHSLKGKCVDFLRKDKVAKGLWIGTYGDGLYFLRDGASVPVRVVSNLKSPHNMIPDKCGRCWIPTNNGLFVTSHKALVENIADSTRLPFFYRFDQNDGLKITEFNSPGHCNAARLENGWLALASMDGLVWLQPDSIPTPFSKSAVSIKEILVDGKRQPLGAHVRIREDASFLVFKVLAGTVGQSGNKSIEYSLNSTDDRGRNLSWTEVAGNEEIVFTHLAPGNYELVLRRRSGFEWNNFIYTRYYVEVTPLWYHNRIYQLIWAGVLLFTIALIVWWRLNVAKLRMKEMGDRIRRITAQLRDRNEALETSNEFKEKIITVLGHDISIPMHYLNQTLKKITDDKDTPGHISEQLALLYQESYETEIFANDLLTWLKEQNRNEELRVRYSKVPVKDLIIERWSLFEKRARQKGIGLAFAENFALEIDTDPKILSIIFHNLFDNFVKFTGSAQVYIDARQDSIAGLWMLSFTERRELRSPGIYSSEDHFVDQPGRGFGMKLIKDFALAINLAVSFLNSQEGFKVTLQPEWRKNRPKD